MLWTHPAMLLWWLPAAAVIAWFHRRSLSDFSPAQRWTSTITRLVVATLLIVALADPVWTRPAADRAMVVAVDRSGSVDAGARKQADRWVAELSAAARASDVDLRVLDFADVPGQPVRAGQWEANLDPDPSPPDPPPDPPLGTDIGLAIRTAAASMPPTVVADVLVITDGNDTTGGDPAAGLAGTLANISAMPLPVRSEPEVQVTAVQVPASVRQGQPFLSRSSSTPTATVPGTSTCTAATSRLGTTTSW